MTGKRLQAKNLFLSLATFHLILVNFMNLEYITYAAAGLSVILLGLVIWLIIRLRKLDKIRKEFFSSGLNQNIEQVLIGHNKNLEKLNDDFDQMSEYVSSLTMANKNNMQKVGFVRYNPFGDTGGNISFVLALLDANDNGFVMSSLHGREGNRIYAKEISKGVSKSQLTKEEQQAIKEAK